MDAIINKKGVLVLQPRTPKEKKNLQKWVKTNRHTDENISMIEMNSDKMFQSDSNDVYKWLTNTIAPHQLEHNNLADVSDIIVQYINYLKE